MSAIERLQPVISSKIPLPPDLYAEMERVAGNVLLMSGAADVDMYISKGHFGSLI